MATIADVARRAGVSIATVSRVLSPGPNPHPVRAATARKVHEAAAALDFVPSALARGLASRRSGLLGLIVKDLEDPHYPHIARGAEDVARQEGLVVLICNTLGDSARLAEYLRVLRARHADALVLSGGGSLSAEDLQAVAAAHVPAVIIGRPAEDAAAAPPYVAVDNQQAAADATRHLLDTGRRRVVHLSGPRGQTTMADRAAGYRAALADAGLVPEVVETDGSADAGLTAAQDLLARPAATRPDAIFAATDRLAYAVLAAAADRGVRVPADLAVVGFDDLPLSAYLRPALTSVAQPARQLGERAMRLALQLASGEAHSRPPGETLPAHLVVRASSQSA